MLRPLKSLGLVGLALLGFACTGGIGGGGDHSSSSGAVGSGSGSGSGSGASGSGVGSGSGASGNGSGAGSGSGVSPAGLPSDDATVPGPAPLRRLTRLEYQNSVRDLLGLTTVPGDEIATFSADIDSGGSGFTRGGSITAAPDAREVMMAAEELANTALPQIQGLLPCNPLPTATGDQDACADKFFTTFGRRAYRRPLQDAEIADLHTLYAAQRQAPISADFPHAMATVVSAMLQSPYFLYRWEQGPTAPTRDGMLVRFSQNEMASRLSYLFWASMPDDKLFDAADKGELGTPDQIAAQARRLLADPKAADALNDFHIQWLNIGVLTDLPKDPSLTDYSPEVAKSMVKETRAFISSIFQGPKADGKFQTLLTSQASFADANLAKIYGLKNLQGTDLQPVTYDASQRAGLLTQGTFLTAKADAIDSHPIKRGDTILEHMLCMNLAVPGNLVIPPLPEPKPGQTVRQRVTVHASSPCATCHVLIDPVGFAFENYDAIGKYRTTDEGQPVDATGSFPLDKGTASFKNALELVPQLAKSQQVQDCLVTQWWRYALRRQELASEEPSLKLVRAAFAQSGQDMRELLVAFTRTRAFSLRQPSPDEVLP